MWLIAASCAHSISHLVIYFALRASFYTFVTTIAVLVYALDPWFTSVIFGNLTHIN